jgi:rhomboid protease GluP
MTVSRLSFGSQSSESQSDGEIIPPLGPPESVPDYHPAEVSASAQTKPRTSWRSRRSDLFAAPATYILVGINVAVFLWMLFTGVSFNSTSDLIRFGATSTSLMQDHGQWYRLVTAIFVHGGWIHLLGNMWCLWNLGMLGEPLLGPLGLVAVYILTGAGGNLLSLAWNVSQNHDEVGVGASGAVFGIAGILIVLLSNRKLPIPWEELRRLRRSVLQFAVLNLIIGGATIFGGPIRIDNSAHIGGFVSGLALGPALVPRMTSGRERYLGRQKVTFAIAALALSLFGYLISSMR